MLLKIYEIAWGETVTASGTMAGAIVTYDLTFSDQGLVGPPGPSGPEGPQGLAGDFVVNFRVVTTGETLVSKAKIAANTTAGAFTLTLPATPANGDVIDFYDYAETFDANPLTLARNGSKIESLEENLICNVKGAYFSLVYSGSTRGWQVLPSFGTAGGGGESALTTRGDMLYRGAGASTRLPIGAAGQILKVNSGGNAPEWGAAPATGVTSVALSSSDFTVSGSPVTSSGTITANLANSGVSAGTYTKVTVDAKGRVTTGATAGISDVTGLQTALDGKAATSHSHSISDVTSLQTSLDGKAATSHTHSSSAITDFNAAAAAAAPVQSVAGRAGAVTLAVADVSGAVSTSDSRLSDARTPNSTLAHASTHHTGGTDALAPSQIGAQSLFTTTTSTITGNTTITAGRALIYQVTTTSAVTADINLPSSGHQAGDIIVVRSTTPFASGSVLTIKSGSGATLDTITSAEQAFRYTAQSNSPNGWIKVPVDTHTHPASAITDLSSSGNAAGLYDNAAGQVGAVVNDFSFRINGDAVSADFDTANLTASRTYGLPNANGILARTDDFAAPPAIGNTTRNTGAFTTLSAAPTSGSALTLTGGTVTASAPVLDATQTWNNAAVTFTGLRVNVTNTASAAASLLADVQVGGSNVFSINRAGALGAGGAAWLAFNSAFGSAANLGGVWSFGNGQVAFNVGSSLGGGSGTVQIGAGASLGWSSNTQPTAANADLRLWRDAADTLALQRTTSPQTFRIYSTFTSTTSFERLNIAAQTGGSFIIGTEKGSGGGTARGLELRTDNVARINISSTGGIGFYGAAASAQPAAVADATDAATVITQLNALLSRLRTIGVIAT